MRGGRETVPLFRIRKTWGCALEGMQSRTDSPTVVGAGGVRRHAGDVSEFAHQMRAEHEAAGAAERV